MQSRVEVLGLPGCMDSCRESSFLGKVRARQEARSSGSVYTSQGWYQNIHSQSTKSINNIYLLHKIE